MVVKRVLAAAGALVLTAVVVASVSDTSALWRDASSLNGGAIRSGELSLLNGNATIQTASYTFNELAASDLVPGSWSQAPLTLLNGGSADLAYRLAGVAATNPTGLPASMTLSVQRVQSAAGCPTGPGAAAPPGPVVELYEGPLLGATTTTTRPLSIGAREVLCIRVAVAGSAPQTAQDRSTAITFTFAAVST